MIELGVETSHNDTLFLINRNHTWQQATRAIEECAARGFDVGVHLIMGLPGETRPMMLETVGRMCQLPVTSLKLHQLQIVRNTTLHHLWEDGKIDVELFSLDDYLDFCVEILRHIPPHIAVERFTSSTPAPLLVAPCWGIKNYQFANLLNSRLKNMD